MMMSAVGAFGERVLLFIVKRIDVKAQHKYAMSSVASVFFLALKPACSTVHVSARRCLTSNAIFRGKCLIALSDCGEDEWRLVFWKAQ